MPNKMQRLCAHSGCSEIVERGYCDKHAKTRLKDKDKNRLTAHQRGYTSKWTKYAKAYIAKHPLCVECARNDRVTASKVVDHIVPHKGDKKLFWDKTNHQALCKRCHDIKTAKEDGGFGNPVRM